MKVNNTFKSIIHNKKRIAFEEINKNKQQTSLLRSKLKEITDRYLKKHLIKSLKAIFLDINLKRNSLNRMASAL